MSADDVKKLESDEDFITTSESEPESHADSNYLHAHEDLSETEEIVDESILAKQRRMVLPHDPSSTVSEAKTLPETQALSSNPSVAATTKIVLPNLAQLNQPKVIVRDVTRKSDSSGYTAAFRIIHDVIPKIENQSKSEKLNEKWPRDLLETSNWQSNTRNNQNRTKNFNPRAENSSQVIRHSQPRERGFYQKQKSNHFGNPSQFSNQERFKTSNASKPGDFDYKRNYQDNHTFRPDSNYRFKGAEKSTSDRKTQEIANKLNKMSLSDLKTNQVKPVDIVVSDVTKTSKENSPDLKFKAENSEKAAETTTPERKLTFAQMQGLKANSYQPSNNNYMTQFSAQAQNVPRNQTRPYNPNNSGYRPNFRRGGYRFNNPGVAHQNYSVNYQMDPNMYANPSYSYGYQQIPNFSQYTYSNDMYGNNYSYPQETFQYPVDQIYPENYDEYSVENPQNFPPAQYFTGYPPPYSDQTYPSY